MVTQQYPPEELRERRYYEPTTRGAERVLGERAAALRAIVRGEPAAPARAEPASPAPPEPAPPDAR